MAINFEQDEQGIVTLTMDMPNRSANVLNSVFYEAFVGALDHISADSHATRQDLIEQLNVPPQKVTTVHLSVNPLYQRPYSQSDITQTLKTHNLPHGFILAVGTLEPRKNYPTLIRALPETVGTS